MAPTKKKKPAKAKKKAPAARKPAAKKAAPKRPGPKTASARKRATAERKPGAGKKATGGRKPARRPLSSKRPAARRKPAPRATGPLAPLKDNPEGLKLARTIAVVAADKKAEDVLILDVRRRGASVGYDYVVLASGDTDRQLSAIAEAVADAVRPDGRRPSSTEAGPEWVLVNYDDVVAHFFTPEKRAVYDIEGLWVDAPRVRAGS